MVFRDRPTIAMTIYALLKLIHLMCVVASGTLFALRFALLSRRPTEQLPKPLKVLPHVIDTALLGTAIGMLSLTGVNPFQVTWLTAKIIALIAYIGCGALCLRSSPGSRRQTVLFLISASVFFYIVGVALSKQAALLNS